MHFTILVLLVGIPTTLALTYPNPVFNPGASLATINLSSMPDYGNNPRVIDLEPDKCYAQGIALKSVEPGLRENGGM